MVIIADRRFRNRAATPLVTFFKTLGTNISTKPKFAAFRQLGEDLIAENVLMNGYNEAVEAKDLREVGNRDSSRLRAIRIALNICTEVNKVADNDPGVYGDAGLDYVEAANPDRPIGATAVKSVNFNSATGRVDVRVKKADRATGYHIDLKTSTGEIMKEYATIAGTKGSFPAPSVRGSYRCRATPFDAKGNFGEPSAWSDDFGVY